MGLVFPGLLELTPHYKLELRDVHANGFEGALDEESVVFTSVFDLFKGRLAVHVCVLVGEQDLDMASCVEKLGDLDHGNEVTAVGFSSWCGSPVDPERLVSFEDHIVDDLWVQDFCQVGLDQGNRFLWCHGGQLGGMP